MLLTQPQEAARFVPNRRIRQKTHPNLRSSAVSGILIYVSDVGYRFARVQPRGKYNARGLGREDRQT